MESNKKFKIATIILTIVIILLIAVIGTGIIYYLKEKNKMIEGNYENSIPAIINEDNVTMKIRNKDE